MRPLVQFALAALLALTAGAACGGGDDDAPVFPPTTDSPAGDPAPPQDDPAAAASSAPASDDPAPADGEGDVTAADAPPSIGPREQSLIDALAEHIDALNALDRDAFIGRFLDDCGDPQAAGALSYAFGAPLVEAGAQASSAYESIRFIADDLALVSYQTQLPADLWVVHEGAWRISTCPPPDPLG